MQIPNRTDNSVVDPLAQLGIDVSETHVRRIKFQLLRNEPKAARHRAQRPIKVRRKKRPQQRKTLGR